MCLYELIRLDPHDEADVQRLDGDAIIQEVQQNPSSIEKTYRFRDGNISGEYYKCFPLHQAIMLKAPVEVVNALCSRITLKGRVCIKGKLRYDDYTAFQVALMYRASLVVLKLLLEKCPHAVKDKTRFEEETALHIACQYEAPQEVVSLILSTWPDASKELCFHWYAPLHAACKYNAPLEVVSLLITSYSGALQQETTLWYQPLHVACRYNASVEVVSLLISSWPGALQQTRKQSPRPLHIALKHRVSAEVVSLLLDARPGALREKDNNWNTPLHMACQNGASFEVILLLVDQWPEATVEINVRWKTPLILAQRSTEATEDTKTLLSHVSTILSNKLDDDNDNDENSSSPSRLKIMMNFFVDVMWWKGVQLILNKYPSVTKAINLETHAMADFLSMVGRRCTLNTMWEVIQNEQELLAHA